MSGDEEREILHALETPGRLETPVKKFKLTGQICHKTIALKKTPGHDLITGRILKSYQMSE
jgi:hypothetical protein